MSEMQALIRYNEACRALAEAKDVDEVQNIHNKAEAIRAYARQSQNRQLEIDVAEIRIRAERRMGELLQTQKGAGLMATSGDAQRTRFHKETESPPTLTDLGISKKLSIRSQQLARMPEPAFEAALADWRKDAEVTTSSIGLPMPHVVHHTGEAEWYTPPHILERARSMLGQIDLDPASSVARTT